MNSVAALSLLLGMRYKRRGVDADGHVANYVETEQLIHVHSHTLSFVQTRGSVPVFWSQAGYRYNPRPRLEKGQQTMSPSKQAFCLMPSGKNVYMSLFDLFKIVQKKKKKFTDMALMFLCTFFRHWVQKNRFER